MRLAPQPSAGALGYLRDLLARVLHPDVVRRIDDAIEAENACARAREAALEARLAALEARLANQPGVPASPATAAENPGPVPRVFTAERNAIIQREWPAGTPPHVVAELVCALPGDPVDVHRIGIQAGALGVKRPDWYRSHQAKQAGRLPKRKIASPARDAIIVREWKAGTRVERIVALVNDLPGEPMDRHQVRHRARDLKASRPPGFRSQYPVSAKPAPPEVPATPPPPVVPQPAPVAAPLAAPAPAKPPPKIAAYTPPAKPALPVPPLKTAAQLQRERDAAAIADHIARRGVTRCPTAFVEPTSATVPDAERRAVAAHDATIEAARMQQVLSHSPSGKIALAKLAKQARQREA